MFAQMLFSFRILCEEYGTEFSHIDFGPCCYIVAKKI